MWYLFYQLICLYWVYFFKFHNFYILFWNNQIVVVTLGQVIKCSLEMIFAFINGDFIINKQQVFIYLWIFILYITKMKLAICSNHIWYLGKLIKLSYKLVPFYCFFLLLELLILENFISIINPLNQWGDVGMW